MIADWYQIMVITMIRFHSFHRAGAAHPHLPHRVRAPPHLVFGKSSVWVRRPAINGIWVVYKAAKSMYTARSLAS